MVTPDEIRNGDRFGYKVMAVIHSDQSWCAYRGNTEWSDEQIAQNGDEISHQVARELFPTLANSGRTYENL